jgi:hypothetical protein
MRMLTSTQRIDGLVAVHDIAQSSVARQVHSREKSAAAVSRKGRERFDRRIAGPVRERSSHGIFDDLGDRSPGPGSPLLDGPIELVVDPDGSTHVGIIAPTIDILMPTHANLP